MPAVDFTREEISLLLEVLDNVLSDLRAEIADTDSSTFKHQLQERKKLLIDAMEKLKSAKI